MLAPDKAVLNVIDIIENGETPYKLITTEKGLAIDSKFQIEDSNNFKLTFTLQPDMQKKGIDLNYFFQRPFALVTDGMAIHVKNADVIKGSRGLQEDTPCNFTIEIKSFRGDVDDSITIYYFTVKKVENKEKVSFYYENFNSAILSEKPIMDSAIMQM